MNRTYKIQEIGKLNNKSVMYAVPNIDSQKAILKKQNELIEKHPDFIKYDIVL